MATIMIENLFKTGLVVSDHSRTLLQHFHEYSLDWMHECGGKGRCTTCKVIVKQGFEHFSPMTPEEQKYRREGSLHEKERLACQAKIHGNVILIVPNESKLPHLKYSDET